MIWDPITSDIRLMDSVGRAAVNGGASFLNRLFAIGVARLKFRRWAAIVGSWSRATMKSKLGHLWALAVTTSGKLFLRTLPGGDLFKRRRAVG